MFLSKITEWVTKNDGKVIVFNPFNPANLVKASKSVSASINGYLEYLKKDATNAAQKLHEHEQSKNKENVQNSAKDEILDGEIINK